MDKGDNKIRQKVSQAKPYKPRADWDKMEAMLVASEASTGNRYIFFRGFLLGAASLALLFGVLWFSGSFRMGAPVAQIDSIETDSCLDDSNYQPSLTEIHKFDKDSRQEKAENGSFLSEKSDSEAVKGRSDKHGIKAKTAGNDLPENIAQEYVEVKKLEATPFSSQVEKPTALPNSNAAEIAHQSGQGQQELAKEKVLNENLINRLADGPEISLGGQDLNPEGLKAHFPEPVFQAIKDKKWSTGIHLIGLVQPYVASSPIAVGQNPFLYRWHPGVAIEVGRKIRKSWKISLRAGSDDAYYYEGYIPAGSYETASLNELGNSVAVIVGTNYWTELSAKLKMRKKAGLVFDPYVRAGLGYVWSRADFLAIFGVNTDQLSNTEKTSRFQAKDNLSTFVSNPYLVNNRTYVDASNVTSANAEQLVANYSAQNNLSEYYKKQFLSTTFGLGTEIHLGSRWDIDLQANVLSRFSQIVFAIPVYRVESDFSSLPISAPRLSFPEQISFVQLSAGMNYRF